MKLYRKYLTSRAAYEEILLYSLPSSKQLIIHNLIFICDDTLQSTLTSWNLDRVVNGDGNCLFTSVANSLIAHIQSGQVDGQLTLARIGLHEYEFITQ